MPLTAEEKRRLREEAEREGHDPDEAVAAAEEDDAQDGDPEARAPGKSDPAAEGKGGTPAGAESGAKAHGGRGYFAYEYPFLKVNQVLESLFLPPVDDGDMFTGEWLKKHGGGEPSGGAAPNDDE